MSLLGKKKPTNAWLIAILFILVQMLIQAKMNEMEEAERIEVYQQGFDAGSEFKVNVLPPKCTSEEAMRWWNNSADLNQVRKNLCTKKG